jgi:cytidylate kinase
VLKEIAKSESCIVAGRSGFAIFQNWPNSMHIFIQASMEKRIARVIKRQGLSQQEAIAAIEKVDAGRENYLKKNVMTTRYDTRHYDLVLSMDHLTEEQAADIIFDFIQKQAE